MVVSGSPMMMALGRFLDTFTAVNEANGRRLAVNGVSDLRVRILQLLGDVVEVVPGQATHTADYGHERRISGQWLPLCLTIRRRPTGRCRRRWRCHRTSWSNLGIPGSGTERCLQRYNGRRRHNTSDRLRATREKRFSTDADHVDPADDNDTYGHQFCCREHILNLGGQLDTETVDKRYHTCGDGGKRRAEGRERKIDKKREKMRKLDAASPRFDFNFATAGGRHRKRGHGADVHRHSPKQTEPFITRHSHMQTAATMRTR